MNRAASSLVVVLLAALAGVAAWRALGLTEGRSGLVATAGVGERRWFGWAYRDETVRHQLEALRPRVEPGEPLILRPPSKKLDAAWLDVMARYYLPANRVYVGRPGDRGAPAGARVVALPPAGAAGGEGGWAASLILLPGLLLALVAGGSLLVPPAGAPFSSRPAGMAQLAALALAVGLAELAVPLLLWRLSGARLGPLPVVVGGAAVAAFNRFLRRRLGAGWGRTGCGAPEGWLRRAAVVVALVALALFAVKMMVVPLWSWDHFALWGMKARRLAAGVGVPDILTAPELRSWAPQYPLGVPAAWLTLTLGASPGAVEFKLLHLLFGLALALLVVRGVVEAGGAPAAAWTAAALVASSPLFWDTESLGLADLPLALWSVAALILLLRSLELPPAATGIAGGMVGFLPWIKEEGFSLAGLLVAAGLALAAGRGEGRRRWAARSAWLGLPVLASVLLEQSVVRWWQGSGTDFFSGDAWGRFLERLPRASELLRLLAADLARPAWLGFWLLFGVGVVAALRLRRRVPLVVAAVVVGQLGLYMLVYFGTYLPPAAHIRSSFFRIVAAQVPLAAVALGALLGDRRRKGGRPSPGG